MVKVMSLLEACREYEERAANPACWEDAVLCAPAGKAKVKDGVILCDFCNRRAESIHLFDHDPYSWEIKAACKKHDPGGYWLLLKDLAENPWKWLTHLAQKTDLRALHLLRWLGYEGGRALQCLAPKRGEKP